MKHIFYAVFFLFLISCNTPEEIKTAPDQLVIGTFNIAWLGDTQDDQINRTPSEYKNIADIIIQGKFDIIALQEIENASATEILLRYLPGYRFKITTKGNKQNLCFLIHNSVELINYYEYIPLQLGNVRPGLVIEGRKKNFDFIMMDVHFKSTSRFDNTQDKKKRSYMIRRKQSEIVSNWIDSVRNNSSEEDIFILGDFNDNPKRSNQKTLQILAQKNGYMFLTSGLKSCRNKFWNVIDHIYISKSANNRLLKNSVGMINFYQWYPPEVASRLSDHCPVMAVFDVTAPDND